MHSCLILRVKFAYICLEGALASVNDRFKRKLRTYDVVFEEKIFDVYLSFFPASFAFSLPHLFLRARIYVEGGGKLWRTFRGKRIPRNTLEIIFIFVVRVSCFAFCVRICTFLKFTRSENINSNA